MSKSIVLNFIALSNAENVIVIDADNSSSPNLYVNVGREYGMHHRSNYIRCGFADN